VILLFLKPAYSCVNHASAAPKPRTQPYDNLIPSKTPGIVWERYLRGAAKASPATKMPRSTNARLRACRTPCHNRTRWNNAAARTTAPVINSARMNGGTCMHCQQTMILRHWNGHAGTAFGFGTRFGVEGPGPSDVRRQASCCIERSCLGPAALVPRVLIGCGEDLQLWMVLMDTGSVGTCLLEIEFALKPGKRREFNRSLEDLRSQEGHGHIRTTVYEDREEPGHMIWVADWACRQALDDYLSSDAFGVLMGGLKVLGVVTECRIVDESCPSQTVGEGSPSRARTLGEKRFLRFDLTELDGPKN